MQDMRPRVKARLEALGYKITGGRSKKGEPNLFTLAESVGLRREFIYDLVKRGNKAGVQSHNLELLAKALQCSPRYLTFEIDTPWPQEPVAVPATRAPVSMVARSTDAATTLTFGGTCERSWRAVNDPPRAHAIPLAPDPRYPGIAQKVYRLEDIGLIAAGDAYALGIEAEDFARHFGPVRSGAFVIAKRVRKELQEFQLTMRIVDRSTGQTQLTDLSGLQPAMTIEAPPPGETLTIEAVVTLGAQLLG